MLRERLASLVAVLLLAAVTATSYWYARTLRAPRPVAVVTPGSPDFEGENVAITQFDAHGRARSKLFADRLLHFAENDNVELTAPRLVSLRPDQPQLEATAQRAEVESGGERVHLFGDVDVRRAAFGDLPPLRVRSEYLLALPDYDRYSTDQPVEALRGAARITSTRGMRYDNIERSTQFDGDVRIVLPPTATKESR